MDNVENPEIFKHDIIVVLFDNVVKPETFNDDTNEILLFNVINPLTFNDENLKQNVGLLFNFCKTTNTEWCW